MTTARALKAVLAASNNINEKMDVVNRICGSNKCNSIIYEEILNWLLSNIANKSGKTSSDIFSLWKIIEKVLTSLQGCTDDQATCLKSNYIQVFIEEIKSLNTEFELLDLIFNCLSLFLKTASLHGLLIVDSNTLLSLLFVTLDACCKYYEENLAFLKESKSLIGIILEALNNSPYSSDESKLSLYVDSLKEFSSFVYFATNTGDDHPVRNKLIQNLMGIVFNSKSGTYKSLLSTEADNEDSPKEPNISVLSFFRALQKLLKKQKVYGNYSGSVIASSLMKEMMLCVLNQNRSNMEPLSILALFCASCGIDIPLVITTGSCCNNILKVDWSDTSKLLPLSHLLEACESRPEFFLVSDVPEGYLKPSDWLEGILAALLDLEHKENIVYWLKCFCSLTKLSVTLVESNLADFVKLCLLDIDLENVEVKKEYCRYFIQLVSLYSRLNQLPKFYVKLLLNLTECIKNNNFGKLISRGQLYPEILQTLAKQFQELPFGQILELGKIFSEIYTTFANMNQFFAAGKGALFFFSQIFTSFLLHTKLFDEEVPDSVYPKFEELVQNITDELEKNVSVLSKEKKEAQQLQRSFMLLCYAIGEVKIASYCCSDEPSKDSSLLHNFFKDDADCLQYFLQSEDKVLSLLTFQLLVQKVKCLISLKDASEEELSHLQTIVLTLIQHAQENISADASWDLDLCTLDANNYGTAVWRLFLKLIPLVMHMLSHKELISLCSSLREIVLNSQEGDDKFSLNHIVLSHVKSEFYTESKPFQCASVISLWKEEDLLLSRKRVSEEMSSESVSLSDVLQKLSSFRGKWMKYAETTPKCKNGESHNPLWVAIKESCELLNELLLNDDLCKHKMKPCLFNKMKLIKCLPLQYLLPGNQMQCLIGLSVLFFLLPDSSHKTKISELAEQIAILMMKILDGVRSIWLFDFVSSGPFLQKVVFTISKLMDRENCYEIKPWMNLLLKRLVEVISRNNNTFMGLEFYLLKNKKPTKSEADTIFILSLSLILEKLSQLYQRTYISPDFKETRQKMFNLSGRCFMKYLKNYEDSTNELIREYLLLCYMTMIETIHLPDCATDPQVKSMLLEGLPNRSAFSTERLSDNNAKPEIYLKFIGKLCSLKDTLSSYFPENFPLLFWNTVSSYLKPKTHVSSNDVSSNLCYSSEHSCEICTTITKISPCANSVFLQEYEVGALKSIFSVMNGEQLSRIFEEIANDITKIEIESLDCSTLQMNLVVLRHLIDSCSYKEEFKLSPVLNHLHFNIMDNLCQSSYVLYMVKIPVYEFLHFLVKRRASCVPKECLIGTLHSCVKDHLDHFVANISDFTKAFSAIWNIVYDLLLYHPGIVLQSRGAFLAFPSMLLKAIVKAGAQEIISSCDKNEHHQLLLCAQNMDRLLTVICRHKIEFAKLVPYTFADYLCSIQDVTLDSSIKVHLIAGINRILDICSEDSLKMLSVNLNPSCRDMFLNIVKNHNKQKYHGSV